MKEQRPFSLGDYLIVILFLSVIIIVLTITISGIPYILLDSEIMSFWLLIIVPFEAILAGIVFTYSLAQYTLTRQTRDLVLLLMAVNMILGAFLYVLSNEAFIDLSFFANRERNRTIILAFGFIWAPSVLMGSLTNDEVTSMQKRAILVWGALIVPSMALWFFLSPTPVFVSTPVGEGIQGFTPIAWISFIAVPLCTILAIRKYMKSWQMTRNRLDFASGLGLNLWFLAVLLFATQTNPLQLMELIWYSVFSMGTLLIAVVVISASVIEPRKALSLLVTQRTMELEKSREESEFYLNLWGHKIGNLLQGMMLYLGMLSTGNKDSNEIAELSEVALDIGRETTMINRQVAALIKIKEEKKVQLESRNVMDAIQDAMIYSMELIGANCFEEDINLPQDSIRVVADEFLDLVFLNIFTYLCGQAEDPKLSLQSQEEGELFAIDIQSKGSAMPDDIYNSLFSNLEPSRTTLSLDLFIVRILMSKYNGTIQYIRNDESNVNIFMLTFRKSKPQEDVEISQTEESAQLLK
ncbi:MAG: hypothetical protein ACW98Y_03680 [Candidatus Thorarchaeota archaeon]|jgi:hypothetical protein